MGVAAHVFGFSVVMAYGCSAPEDSQLQGGDTSTSAGTGGAGGATVSTSETSTTGGCECDGLACGVNECGADCGGCPASYTCDSGQCICVPDCDGKECGPDACGSVCGTCDNDSTCDAGACKLLPPDPLPDLWVNYIHVDDYTMTPGSTTDVHFQIENGGQADSTLTFDLVIVLSQNQTVGDADDHLLYAWTYPYIIEEGLAYIWYTPVTVPDDVYDGDYYVGIEVDTTGVVEEMTESNNVRFDVQPIKITGNPNADLTPLSVVAQQPNVYPGETADFTVTVKNLGASALASYQIGLYYSLDAAVTTGDILVCTHTDSTGIASLATETLQISCAAPSLAGTYWLGAIADPNDSIGETDETNNVAIDAQQVAVETIDLQTGAVSTNDATVNTSQLVTYTASMTNGGPGDAPSFNVSFYYSTDANVTTGDTKICETNSGGSLAANATLDVQATCSVPLVATGIYWLGAIADAADVLMETDEANNTSVSAATVAITAPDMDVETYLFGSNEGAAASPGEVVDYTIQIKNVGTAPVPQLDAMILYSSDQNLSFADYAACTYPLAGVPALTITQFTFQCQIPQVPAGFYYRGVILDPNNVLPESNEMNNSVIYVGSAVLIQ